MTRRCASHTKRALKSVVATFYWLAATTGQSDVECGIKFTRQKRARRFILNRIWWHSRGLRMRSREGPAVKKRRSSMWLECFSHGASLRVGPISLERIECFGSTYSNRAWYVLAELVVNNSREGVFVI